MPLTEEQENENRELWTAGVLRAFRDHFRIFGDRRDNRDDMYNTVKQYGAGMPLMACACGKSLLWADWPDHWRDNHGI